MSSKKGKKSTRSAPAASQEPEATATPEAAGEDSGMTEAMKKVEMLQMLGQPIPRELHQAARQYFQQKTEERSKKLSVSAADDKPHEFWGTQPVPKLSEQISEHGPIDAEKSVEEVQQEPYELPKTVEWAAIDVTDESHLKELYELLTHNYVEDDDNMFRFDYSADFLRWALTVPGYIADWHVGIRLKLNQQLVGFIAGIPVHMHVYEKQMPMCEINFLCVHKKLRDKKLAPKLIQEVTRRVNLRNIWQAVYTAGVVLPKPVSSCRYYHRSMNPKKLVDVRFSALTSRLTMSRAQKLARVPAEPESPGIRPMVKEDVPKMCRRLNEFLAQFPLHQEFNEEEFAHQLLPREGVVSSYVVETEGEPTDMVSFYHLPSSIIGHDKYKTLYAAYLYYYVPTTRTPKQLVSDALVFAHKEGIDVFNALDLMRNGEFLKDLRFGEGDGNLQYYLYNWACPSMESNGIGMVLL